MTANHDQLHDSTISRPTVFGRPRRLRDILGGPRVDLNSRHMTSREESSAGRTDARIGRSLRVFSGAASSVVALLALAACGGNSAATPSHTPTAPAAPAALQSPSGPSSGATGAPYVESSYRYTLARVSAIVAQTTLNVSGGTQPLDAPPGQTYYAATLTLKNTSGQQEPGINAGSSSELNNVSFAVTEQEASALGESYTQNALSDLGATGPSCVSGSGVINEAFVTSAGTYCRLATGVMVVGIDPASPDDGLSPPQLAPGETETLAVAYGPVQKLPTQSIDLFATEQAITSASDSGFRVPAAGDPSVTYTNDLGAG